MSWGLVAYASYLPVRVSVILIRKSRENYSTRAWFDWQGYQLHIDTPSETTAGRIGLGGWDFP